MAQAEKRSQARNQQIQHRTIGKNATENEQRSAKKDENELERKQEQLWHGAAKRMYQEADFLSTTTEFDEVC